MLVANEGKIEGVNDFIAGKSLGRKLSVSSFIPHGRGLREELSFSSASSVLVEVLTTNLKVVVSSLTVGKIFSLCIFLALHTLLAGRLSPCMI